MTRTTAYRSAVAVAVGAALLLVYGIGALGVIGAESGMFVALFGASAWLFLHAARMPTSPDERSA